MGKQFFLGAKFCELGHVNIVHVKFPLVAQGQGPLVNVISLHRSTFIFPKLIAMS